MIRLEGVRDGGTSAGVALEWVSGEGGFLAEWLRGWSIP